MSNKTIDNFWFFWENRHMIWGKNRVGDKKMKQLERILGVPVQSAFANGPDLPHYVVLAFTGPKEAFLVNIKRGYFKKYLSEGKFCLSRAPKLKVWTARPSPEEQAAKYKDAKQVAEEFFLNQGRNFVQEIKEAEEEIDRRLGTGDPEFDCEPEMINDYGKNPDLWDIT